MQFKSYYLNPERIKVGEVLKLGLEGKIVLPEFQRPFVWGPEDVRELLVSVMGGYFIGTLLIHENTKERTPFAVRPLPFTDKQTNDIPEGSILKIVLDGQQRISSLIYALTGSNIPIKPGNRNPHRFLLDIEKFLESKNLSESILAISMTPNNVRKYIAHEYLHLHQENKLKNVKEQVKYIDLAIIAYDEIIDDLYDDLRESFGKEIARSIKKLWENILDYDLIYIKIPQESTIDEIVEIFERINKTSYKLSTADLLFAKLYKEMNQEARKLILERLEYLKQTFPDLEETFNEITVIKVILLLTNKELKPRFLIKISAKDITEWFNYTIKGLNQTLHFLYHEAGVRKKWIPYTSLIIPLTAMFAYLEKIKETLDSNKKALVENLSREFIKIWYWTNVLSERYDEGISSKSLADFRFYRQFIEKVISTETIYSIPEEIIINFPKIELNKLKEAKAKNSALLKALYNLLILNKVQDFETGKPFDNSFTDEHIFPKSFLKDKKANIVLNRTLTAPETNKYLKGFQKPQKYFIKLEQKYLHQKKKLERILNSHFINDEAFKYLKQNKFEEFLDSRLESIKNFLLEELIIPSGLIK